MYRYDTFPCKYSIIFIVLTAATQVEVTDKNIQHIRRGQGVIYSPGYPKYAEENVRQTSEWIFMASSESPVLFDVKDFELTCVCSGLKVTYKDKGEQTFCGEKITIPGYSTRKTSFYLASPEQDCGRGFALGYTFPEVRLEVPKYSMQGHDVIIKLSLPEVSNATSRKCGIDIGEASEAIVSDDRAYTTVHTFQEIGMYPINIECLLLARGSEFGTVHNESSIVIEQDLSKVKVFLGCLTKEYGPLILTEIKTQTPLAQPFKYYLMVHKGTNIYSLQNDVAISKTPSILQNFTIDLIEIESLIGPGRYEGVLFLENNVSIFRQKICLVLPQQLAKIRIQPIKYIDLQPATFPVIVEISKGSPAFISLSLAINPDKTIIATATAECNNQQECREVRVEMSVQDQGVFTLHVTANNSLGEVSSSEGPIESFSLVGDVFVTSSTPSYIKANTEIIVLYDIPSGRGNFTIEIHTARTQILKKDISNHKSWKDDSTSDRGGLNIPFDAEEYKVFVAEYSFKDPGQHEISAKLSTQNGKQSKESKTNIRVLKDNNKACLQRVTLRDGTLASAIVRSVEAREIALSVDVESTCDSVVDNSYEYRWKIFQVQSLADILDESQLLAMNREMTGNELVIEAGMLPPGLYTIQVTVQEMGSSGSILQDISDFTSVRIPKIKLDSRVCGGLKREIERNTSVVIVDGSCSQNPHVDDVLFEWFCALAEEDLSTDRHVGKFLNKGSCFEQKPSYIGKEKRFGFSTNDTKIEKHFFVRLFTSRENYTDNFADQEIYLLDEPAPEINIKCWANCGSQFKPHETMILEAECPTCETYNWYSTAGSVASCSVDRFCKLDPSVVRMAGYRIKKLKLTGTDADGHYASAEYPFKVLPQPLTKCSVKPSSGTAYSTLFNVSCTFASSVTYKFSLSSENMSGYFPTSSESMGAFAVTDILLQYGYNNFIGIHLPPGKSSVTVEACASNAACTVQTRQISAKRTNERMDKNGMVDLLTNAVKAQNLQKISQLVTFVERKSDIVKELKDDIVQLLLDWKVGSTESAKQIVDTLGQLGGRLKNFGVSMKDKLVKRLDDIERWLEKDYDSSNDFVESVVKSALVVSSSVLDSLPGTKFLLNSNSEHRPILSVLDKLGQQLIATMLPSDEAENFDTSSFSLSASRSANKTTLSRSDRHSQLSLSPDAKPYDIVNFQIYRFNSSNTNFNTPDHSVDEVVGVSLSKSWKKYGEFKPTTESISAKGTVEFALYNNGQTPEGETLHLNRTGVVTLSGSLPLVVKNVENSATSLLQIRFTSKNITDSDIIKLKLNATTEDDVFEMTKNTSGKGFKGAGFTWSVPVKSDISDYNLTIDIESPTKADSIVVHVLPYASQCMFWDDASLDWSSNGCKVLEKTILGEWTWCECGSKTQTRSKGSAKFSHPSLFASKLIVYPKKIDFEKVSWNLWEEYLKNPIMMTTVFAMYLFFGAMMVWAWRKDKEQMNLPPYIEVCDNLPTERYRYLLTAFTGSRRRAGPSSTVAVKLVGNGNESVTHLLQKSDEERILLQGSVVSFLMTAPHSLGGITAIRVWHDNTGDSPEWYLDRMVVRDVETNECWFFIANTWLSDYHMGECQLDILISAATIRQLHSFRCLFTIKCENYLKDRHIWYSLFAMRPWSCYDMSRVQRVACCALLVFMVMLTSLMFYGADDVPSIDLGHYSFEWSHVAKGMESCILCFPVTFIVTVLFRSSRNRKWKDNETERKQSSSTFGGDLHKSKHRPTRTHIKHPKPSLGMPVAKIKRVSFGSNHIEEKLDKQPLLSSAPLGNIIGKTFEKNAGPSMGGVTVMDVDPGSVDFRPLPWFCVYVGWAFVCTIIAGCSVLSVLYGMTYGLNISRQWLVSLLIGIVQSIFAVEPIKAAMLAYFVVMNNPRHDLTDWIPPLRAKVRVQKHEHPTPIYKKIKKERIQNPVYRVPDVEKVKSESAGKLKARVAKRRMKDMSVHLVYLTLLIIVAFGTRDLRALQFKQAVRSMFWFKALQSQEQVHDWLKGRVLDILYGGHNEYFPDGQLLMISPPTLRQQRIAEGEPCVYGAAVPHFKPMSCKDSSSSEDTGTYSSSWKAYDPDEEVEHYSKSESPWEYIPGDPWSLPFLGEHDDYGLGGYIAHLTLDKKNATKMMDYLKETNWVDDRTRIVMLETVLYNSAVRLFCIVLLGMEMPSVGSVHPTVHLMVLKSHHVVTTKDLVAYICLFGVLFMVFYYVYNIVNLAREAGLLNYLRDVWNVLEILTLLVSVGAAVTFLSKATYMDHALHAIRTGADNLSLFYTASVLDYALTCLLAYCVFFTAMRTVAIMEGHPHFRLSNVTLQVVRVDLAGHLLCLLIGFLAFCHSGLIMFHDLEDFSSKVRATQSIVAYAAGAYMNNLLQYHPVHGGVFLLIFLVLYVQLFVNLYAVVLEEAFRESKLILRTIKKGDFVNLRRKQIRSLFAIEGQKRREEEMKEKEEADRKEQEEMEKKLKMLKKRLKNPPQKSKAKIVA